MIGLIGIDNDGKTLIRPAGTKLMKVPGWLARMVQRIQHWFAKKTWR